MDASILKLMDDAYSANGSKPMLLARFGDFFHEKRRAEGIDTPLEKSISDLVAESGKYERFKPYSQAVWWIRLPGQEVELDNTLPVRNSLLWAFVKKLPEGMLRYYHKTEPFIFKDCETELSNPDYVKIDTSDLWESAAVHPQDLSSQERSKLTAHVLAWAKAHELHENAIFSANDTTAPTTSLLSRLIAALSDEERRRISLPLDIIAKLERTK